MDSYFKYCVYSYKNNLFENFREAQKFANQINEKVFLQIYASGNPYKEVFNELCLYPNETTESLTKTRVFLQSTFDKFFN